MKSPPNPRDHYLKPWGLPPNPEDHYPPTLRITPQPWRPFPHLTLLSEKMVGGPGFLKPRVSFFWWMGKIKQKKGFNFPNVFPNVYTAIWTGAYLVGGGRYVLWFFIDFKIIKCFDLTQVVWNLFSGEDAPLFIYLSFHTYIFIHTLSVVTP